MSAEDEEATVSGDGRRCGACLAESLVKVIVSPPPPPISMLKEDRIWLAGLGLRSIVFNIEIGGRGARVDAWKSPVLPLEVNAMYFALATFIPSTV